MNKTVNYKYTLIAVAMIASQAMGSQDNSFTPVNFGLPGFQAGQGYVDIVRPEACSMMVDCGKNVNDAGKRERWERREPAAVSKKPAVASESDDEHNAYLDFASDDAEEDSPSLGGRTLTKLRDSLELPNVCGKRGPQEEICEHGVTKKSNTRVQEEEIEVRRGNAFLKETGDYSWSDNFLSGLDDSVVWDLTRTIDLINDVRPLRILAEYQNLCMALTSAPEGRIEEIGTAFADLLRYRKQSVLTYPIAVVDGFCAIKEDRFQVVTQTICEMLSVSDYQGIDEHMVGIVDQLNKLPLVIVQQLPDAIRQMKQDLRFRSLIYWPQDCYFKNAPRLNWMRQAVLKAQHMALLCASTMEAIGRIDELSKLSLDMLKLVPDYDIRPTVDAVEDLGAALEDLNDSLKGLDFNDKSTN